MSRVHAILCPPAPSPSDQVARARSLLSAAAGHPLAGATAAQLRRLERELDLTLEVASAFRARVVEVVQARKAPR